MRAFIACPLTKAVEEYLKKLCLALPEASLVIPRQFDLTIKFLGDVPDNLLPVIQERLARLMVTPFEAHLSHVGVFSKNYLRVVWAGVEPADRFERIHHEVEEMLAPLVPIDERYAPHITLTRIRSVRDRQQFLDRLAAITVEPISFPGDQLVLMKSELTDNGAVHTPLFTTETGRG